MVILILLVGTQFFLNLESPTKVSAQTQTTPDVYVGVDAAYPSMELNKQLVDRISGYANLLIIGASGITTNRNESNLNELVQYAYSKGMYFIIYTDNPRYPTSLWCNNTINQYGNHFLGLYLFDEHGGHQLDRDDDYLNVWSANDYADAATKFINNVKPWITTFSKNAGGLPAFTADYALYWYDYNAGFSTVFAEFGWNYSRQINVALARGAAAVQNKDWGVMISWTYTHPPYMESGSELYEDMVFAYQSGAKYVVVFDSNPNWTDSVLKDEHYNAMQQFWQYIQNNPPKITTKAERVAYVLPDYYAYGFRGPSDKIWGLWEADSIAYDLSMGAGYLLMLYTDKVDFVYENGQSAYSYGYNALIYWNDSRLFQPQEDLWPNLSTRPTATPTPFPSPKPTASPSPTPSLSPSPSPTPTPTPTPSPTPQPTPTSDPPTTSLLIIEYVYGLAAVVASVGVVGGVYWLKKRRQVIGF